MDKSNNTILIVEDDIGWRELLTELLAEDFSVKSVATYIDAIKSLWEQVQPFRVVIVDVSLDKHNPFDEHGLKLIEGIKEKEKDTKIIIVTGQSDDEKINFERIKRAWKNLDVYEYLLKNPFNHNEFKTIVRGAFEKVQERLNSEINRLQLLNKICESFNDTELRELIFLLNIHNENLPGDAKRDKVMDLISYCERHGRVQELVNTCREERPKVNW